MDYNQITLEIFETERYAKWFKNLRDRKGREIVLARLRRVSQGNFGDCEGVGGGVREMRVHFGPGYRIYLMQMDRQVVILLAGGDKSTQMRDLRDALDMARQLQRGKDDDNA